MSYFLIKNAKAIIEDGVAKFPDRTRFAGSVATGAMMLERLVNYFDFSMQDAVKLLTLSPANIMSMKDRGKIENNLLADFVVFDEKLKVLDVINLAKKYVFNRRKKWIDKLKT